MDLTVSSLPLRPPEVTFKTLNNKYSEKKRTPMLKMSKVKETMWPNTVEIFRNSGNSMNLSYIRKKRSFHSSTTSDMGHWAQREPQASFQDSSWEQNPSPYTDVEKPEPPLLKTVTPKNHLHTKLWVVLVLSK